MGRGTVSKCRFGNKLLTISAFLAILLVSIIVISAQDKQQPNQSQQPKQTDFEPKVNSVSIGSGDEDYLMAPGDIVEIKIEDAPELSGSYRVNARGRFTFPILGELTAEKKTTEEFSRVITEKLRGGYLMNPIVSVTVAQKNSKAFFIQGAVHNPGIFHIESSPSLLKLITIAGGLTDNYGSTAFIIREKKQTEGAKTREQSLAEKGAGKTQIDSAPKEDSAASAEKTENDSEGGTEYDLIKVNINNLLRGNFEQNIIIQPGDIVHIPRTDIFFVAGEVKKPGSFPLNEGTTLRQAISLAQGTNFEGNLSQSVIFREDQKTGKREEIKINVAAVMTGKQDDIAIQPNDIIMVPNSKKKAIANSLLKTLSGSWVRILGY